MLCAEQICAACDMTEIRIFSLLGTCEVEVRNVYFIVYQEAIGELVFKGYGQYHIRKDVLVKTRGRSGF